MKRQTSLIIHVLTCASILLGFVTSVQSAEELEDVGTYEKLHRQYISENPLYPDTQVQAYINKVGQRMAAVSKSGNIDYQFFLENLDN